MKEPSTSPWTWATLAASLATCGLVVTGILIHQGRIVILLIEDLKTPILVGLALTAGFCVAAWNDSREGRGQPYGRWLAVWYAAGALAFLVGVSQFYSILEFGYVRTPSYRSVNSNNLKQLILALVCHTSEHGNKLPGPAIRAPDGTPLLSWRVAILPYIEEEDLYKQFRLTEPWDSQHNIKLLPRMPQVFRYHRSRRSTPEDRTYWQAFVGKGTAFERAGLNILNDFPDGTSNTIGVIEAANAVPWTKPEDLAYDPSGPIPAFGAVIGSDPPPSAALVGMMDGSVRSIERTISEKTLRGAITRNGNETLGSDW